MTETLLFHLRPARRRARECAVAEALCLLEDLGATALPGGPLSEQGGVFWIAAPAEALEEASGRLPRLGYTFAVDHLEHAVHEGRRTVTWKGKPYNLERVYQEDADLLRDRAPDRRLFALETPDGETRVLRGYRGDGGTLSRRALAVCDARLVVNLARIPGDGVFLDPFAGAGGIVLEAIDRGWKVLSSDADPVLRPGLERLGATHTVADARRLPLAPESVQMIATEPPYDESATRAVLDAVPELHRVLSPGGKLVMICAGHQSEGLRGAAAVCGLHLWLDSPLDRKGFACSVLAWRKPV